MQKLSSVEKVNKSKVHLVSSFVSNLERLSIFFSLSQYSEYVYELKLKKSEKYPDIKLFQYDDKPCKGAYF